MVQLWDNLDNYRKFSTLIMLFSMLFLILLFVREFLKMTDKDYKYNHPSFWSIMSVFCFLSLDGLFSLIFLALDMNMYLAEIFGAAASIALTPICFFASKYLSKVIRDVGVVYSEQLVNCTGMAVTNLNLDGGSVCVNYKNRFIDAKAISTQEIANGEEIVVIGVLEGNLICEKK